MCTVTLEKKLTDIHRDKEHLRKEKDVQQGDKHTDSVSPDIAEELLIAIGFADRR